MSDIQIDEKVLKEIADLVYETCGIVFKESNLTVLISRLSSKLKEKHTDAAGYLRMIRESQNELMSFIDFVTTNFTSFFRNPRHFELLTEEILPVVLPRVADKKKIIIWSAGCSTGEEPYTIAMVMQDYFTTRGLYAQGYSFQVIGSDISLESLFIAKEGRFPAKSMERVDPSYLSRYFIEADGSYIVKDEIKKMVRFDYHNLIYDNGLRDIDIGFCRNVLIYFDEDVQKRVVSNIHLAMKPSGYLFIGHSESLIGLYEGFKPQNLTKGVIYVRH